MSQNESDLEGLMLMELVHIYTSYKNKIAIDLYGQGRIESRSDERACNFQCSVYRQHNVKYYYK